MTDKTLQISETQCEITSKPTQPSAASLPIFDELKGIDEARDVQARPQTTLEKLLEIERRIVPEFASLLLNAPYDDGFQDAKRDDYLELVCSQLYTRLKETELADVELTESDISAFVSAISNNEYQYHASMALGYFTGNLVTILTQRNKVKGTSTKIYVNGNGNRFDYLFYGVKEADELVIDNFEGDYICSLAGTLGGRITSLVIQNCRGEHLASGAGSWLGRLDNLCMIDNKGKGAAYSVGSNSGVAGNVVVINQEGDETASSIGGVHGRVGNVIIINNRGNEAAKSIAWGQGRANKVIILNNEGDEAAKYCAQQQGKVNYLIILNNKGKLAAQEVAKSHGQADTVLIMDNEGNCAAGGAGAYDGHIENLILMNCKGDYNLAGCGNIGDLLLINNEGKVGFTYKWVGYKAKVSRMFIGGKFGFMESLHFRYFAARYVSMKTPIFGDIAMERYNNIAKEKKLQEVIDAAKALEGKSYQDILYMLGTVTELRAPVNQIVVLTA